MRVGNIDVFQESVIIASHAIKCCGKCFWNPTPLVWSIQVDIQVKLIIARRLWCGLYIGNRRTDAIYSKVETAVNRLPELPNFSVDGFCAETKSVWI
jgi:hypothetical protein